MNILLIMMLSTGAGLSYQATNVPTLEACHTTSNVIFKFMDDEGHLITWGKSNSYYCIDAKTGKPLSNRKYF